MVELLFILVFVVNFPFYSNVFFIFKFNNKIFVSNSEIRQFCQLWNSSKTLLKPLLLKIYVTVI